MAVVFGVVWLISGGMGQVNLNRVTLAIVVAILMLSLVPLTGWAGQVSLAQITFAGAGAFAMYQWAPFGTGSPVRSEEHTSELQSQSNLVCRLLLEKKK